jgi:hypothetical protein
VRIAAAIPARAGLGLKSRHYRDILEAKPELGFFEIHAENYMGAGGPPHKYLEAIRESYPLSLHGVGASIGGAQPLDQAHLARLKTLNQRYEPGLFSEHLAWSTHEQAYFADLLPLPYTRETLRRVCDHIDQVQNAVGRRMLLENPSSYFSFEESEFGEPEFMAEIVKHTECGLLLDINNVFISAVNLGFAPHAYIDAYPLAHVEEIHLAGHDRQSDDDGSALLIDDHAHPIADEVWALYVDVIARAGPLPTLIERDGNVPPFAELVAEARRADFVLSHETCKRAA